MNCELRKWSMSDAPELARLLNNRKILNNLRDGIPFPYTQRDAEEFLSSTLAADPTQTFAFAITADGVLAGSIAAFRGGNVHFRTAEVGYYLGEPWWGQGIAAEAVKQLCRYVFEETDILRLFAEPFARNAASCRVLEKAGFRLEGTLRSNAVKNGEILDMKLYALVKADFCRLPNSQTLTVRSMRQEDAEPAALLWLNANQTAHSFIHASYWQENFEAVKEMLPQAEVYVCREEESGELLGFLGLQGDYIAGLFVREGKRSQGIGKRLLDHAKSKKTALWLNAYQKNEGAVRFYLREGFRIQAEGCDEATGEREYRMAWAASHGETPAEKEESDRWPSILP